MGVELVVLGLGEERALRTEGIEGGVATEGLALNGEVTRENCKGFEMPSIVLDFLVGESSIGSTFSESWSSNTEGARRLRDAGCACFCGLRGDEKSGRIARK
jgi:hypothetical protein